MIKASVQKGMHTLLRSAKRACVDGIEWHMTIASVEEFGLFPTGFIQLRIDPRTLNDTEFVEICLSMTDEKYAFLCAHSL